MTEDADILLVGYGIVSRVLRSAVDHARAQGHEGRPVPSDHTVAVPVAGAGGRYARPNALVRGRVEHRADGGRRKLALNGRCQSSFMAARGGNVPSAEEITDATYSARMAKAGPRLTDHGRRRRSALIGGYRQQFKYPSKSPRLLRQLRAKGELQQQTHYCPGCGHGIAHKLIARSPARTGRAGPRHPGQPGRLLGVRLLLLRHRQCAGRARARPGGGHRA